MRSDWTQPGRLSLSLKPIPRTDRTSHHTHHTTSTLPTRCEYTDRGQLPSDAHRDRCNRQVTSAPPPVCYSPLAARTSHSFTDQRPIESSVMTAPPHHHDRHRLLHHKLTMPAAARYYQSDDPALDFWEDTDVPALSPPRTARARPASPSRTATPSPEAALKAGSASSPSASASAAEPHRPLACVVPPSLVAEREDMERQRAWRSARWNELHYHHKDSLAQELEKRILLLIWITVELVSAASPHAARAASR